MIRNRVDAVLRGTVSLAALGLLTWMPLAPANAQSAAEQLLKQVLPGVTQDDDGAVAEDGERACERYAEDDGLRVDRVVGTRTSGRDTLEVTLRLEDRDDRFEAVCVYNAEDRRVQDFKAERGSARSDDVDEQLARRARDACWDAAKRRNLEEIDLDSVRERSRDTVEVTMRAEDRGDRLDVTCLYDDEKRQAFLAD